MSKNTPKDLKKLIKSKTKVAKKSIKGKGKSKKKGLPNSQGGFEPNESLD